MILRWFENKAMIEEALKSIEGGTCFSMFGGIHLSSRYYIENRIRNYYLIDTQSKNETILSKHSYKLLFDKAMINIDMRIEYKVMDKNNFYIKCLSEEHGAEIIKSFKEVGIDTGNSKGNIIGYYYGVIDGGFCYGIYDKSICQGTYDKSKGITLEQFKKEYKNMVKWVKVSDYLPEREGVYKCRNHGDEKKFFFVKFPDGSSTWMEDVISASFYRPTEWLDEEIKYPCLMEVSYYEDFSHSVHRIVVFHDKNLSNPYRTYSGITSFLKITTNMSLETWKYARPIKDEPSEKEILLAKAEELIVKANEIKEQANKL